MRVKIHGRFLNPRIEGLDQETSGKGLYLYTLAVLLIQLSPAADHSCASNDGDVRAEEGEGFAIE